jgi:hypothetical protein
VTSGPVGRKEDSIYAVIIGKVGWAISAENVQNITHTFKLKKKTSLKSLT